MRSRCVRIVDNLCVQLGKRSGQSSTHRLAALPAWAKVHGKALVSRNSLPSFPSSLSPRKYSYLPLVEHYLYPVSTVPINNSSKGN